MRRSAFLPKDTAFVAAFETDPEGDQVRAVNELLDKFPFNDQIRQSLREQIEEPAKDIRFDDDVKPLLGNPVVVGAVDAEAITGESDDFVAAMEAKDGDALDKLVDKAEARKTGEASGATLYESGDSRFAVEGDMVVFANSDAQLKQALARADGDDHFDEDAFNDGLDGLPLSALARLYMDLETLLKADPGTTDARKVRWIAALRTLGMTASAKQDAVEIDFRLRTEGDLADEDLPIAPGEDAPPVIKREGEVGLGIRDLAHIVRFAENAAQSIDPAGFGDYTQAKKTIDRQLGVSLDDDLIGQFTGDASASLALDGDFGVRSELKDPQAFERTLAKVADVLPNFAEGAGFRPVELSKPAGGRGLLQPHAGRRRHDRLRCRRRRARGGGRPRPREPAGFRGPDGGDGRRGVRRAERRRRAAREHAAPAVRRRLRPAGSRGRRHRAAHRATRRPEWPRVRERG